MPRLTLIKRRLVGWREHGEVHDGLDLRSMLAPQSEWINTRFVDCKMNLAVFRGSKLIGCTFSDCQIDLGDFSGCTIASTQFLGCGLEQSSFAQTDLKDVEFSNCRMNYSTFAGGTCRGSVAFENCNLHGGDIDFLECDKGSPKFTLCNLWGVRVAMGCSTWNGELDLVTAKRFTAMLHRMHPSPELARFAGEQVAVVERLMGGEDVG